MKNETKNKEPENLLFLQFLLLPLRLLSLGTATSFSPALCPHHPWSNRNFFRPAVGWTHAGIPTVHYEFLLSVALLSSFSHFIIAAAYLLTASKCLSIGWTLFFLFSIS